MNWIHKRSRKKGVWHALLLALTLFLGAYYCPTPYWLEAPGPTYNAHSLVHIQGTKTYPSQGRFLLLTVVSEPATLLDCLYSLFTRGSQLTTGHSTPQAQSDAAEDAWQMSMSQNVSTSVALGYAVDLNPDQVRGLQVVQVIAESPNASVLKPEDVMTKLDGKPIRSLRQIAQELQPRAANSPISATLERAGKPVQVTLKVWQNGPRPMLGARFSPALGQHGKPINVQIDSEQVVGASGGLVFCLEVLDQMIPADLTGGRIVAATGTLDRRGRVGPIQGVHFKLLAAQQAGAQLFLCPFENAQELRGEATTVKVVGVKTLGEALQVLRAKQPP